MPNTPAVTYIIPSYNHCPYVEQAILSVMNQDYDDIELIVLDDGSTDGSRELLQKLSSKLGFIYGEHPNMGCAATLHKGFKMARGKYVCTLASDDWIP
ncbi:glycosyl transferase family 2, partial [bacterium DOLZORAL124_64_63]